MKSLLVFGTLCAAFILMDCASTKVDTGFYSGKRPKYSIDLEKDGRKNGTETWWYPTGMVKYTAINLHGVREGKFTSWYPDGKMWYEGFEYHSKPESTLTYWYPNGNIKSEALFRDGIQLERKDYDEDGMLIAPKPAAARENVSATDDGEAAAAGGLKLRQLSLQMWASRVRQTVEGYWVIPKKFQDRPYRSVAKIQVDREGRILGITWIEKSPNAAFNTLAQQTFKRIKRLPAFPPQIKDPTLDVQYEFISLGKQAPRRKLEARDPTAGETTDQ
jgi:hypothetical protein